MQRTHTRPSYRNPNGDPTRWLLAAVVYQAIRDCSAEFKVKPKDRASAEWFLSGEEGLAWLRAFGIPERKARAFVSEIREGA